MARQVTSGLALRALMQVGGMSYRDLAAVAEVSTSTVGRLASGGRCAESIAKRIQDALAGHTISAETLFTDATVRRSS